MNKAPMYSIAVNATLGLMGGGFFCLLYSLCFVVMPLSPLFLLTGPATILLCVGLGCICIYALHNAATLKPHTLFWCASICLLLAALGAVSGVLGLYFLSSHISLSILFLAGPALALILCVFSGFTALLIYHASLNQAPALPFKAGLDDQNLSSKNKETHTNRSSKSSEQELSPRPVSQALTETDIHLCSPDSKIFTDLPSKSSSLPESTLTPLSSRSLFSAEKPTENSKQNSSLEILSFLQETNTPSKSPENLLSTTTLLLSPIPRGTSEPKKLLEFDSPEFSEPSDNENEEEKAFVAEASFIPKKLNFSTPLQSGRAPTPVNEQDKETESADRGTSRPDLSSFNNSLESNSFDTQNTFCPATAWNLLDPAEILFSQELRLVRKLCAVEFKEELRGVLLSARRNASFELDSSIANNSVNSGEEQQSNGLNNASPDISVAERSSLISGLILEEEKRAALGNDTPDLSLNLSLEGRSGLGGDSPELSTTTSYQALGLASPDISSTQQEDSMALGGDFNKLFRCLMNKLNANPVGAKYGTYIRRAAAMNMLMDFIFPINQAGSNLSPEKSPETSSRSLIM